jgi:hypothetical protein
VKVARADNQQEENEAKVSMENEKTKVAQEEDEEAKVAREDPEQEEKEANVAMENEKAKMSQEEEEEVKVASEEEEKEKVKEAEEEAKAKHDELLTQPELVSSSTESSNGGDGSESAFSPDQSNDENHGN